MRLLTAALCVALADAQAIGVGDAQVGSYMGRPLHLEIPLRLNPGETVDDNCVHLLPGEPGSGDTTSSLQLQVHVVQTPVAHLVVDSRRAATEPYAKVRLRLDCGSAGLVRDYAVLLDPPPATRSGNGLDAPSIDVPGGRLSAGIALSPGRSAATMATATATLAAGDAPARHGKHHHKRSRTGHHGKRQSQLRLDAGDLTPHRKRHGGALPGGVLRLETHADFPTAATPALTAQRAPLKELRNLMLNGDDSLERVLALQAQVGELEQRVRALQAGAPHPLPAGRVPPLPVGAAPPSTAGAAPAATPGAPPAAITAPVAGAPVAAASRPPSAGTVGFPSSSTDPAYGSPAPSAAAGGTTSPAGPGIAAMPPAFLPAARTEPRLPKPPAPGQPRFAPLPDDDLDWLLPASLGVIAAACLGGLLWWQRRRKRRAEWFDATAEQIIAKASLEVSRRPPGPVAAEPREAVARQPEVISVPTAPVDSQKAARAAYLAERFPEIGAGLISLHDSESVVNGARLYVESGDRDRAEELLEAAIQERGAGDIRPWLALFEVQRLKGDANNYAHLLGQFRTHFATSRYLPEVLAVGRQIDPGRPEFSSPSGVSPDAYANTDGTTWLNPELDFVPQALAQDLHDTLMAELVEDEAPAAVARGIAS